MNRFLLSTAVVLGLATAGGLSGAMAQTPAPNTARTGIDYVRMAGSSDLYEIQSSQAVLQTTQRDDIRSFAQMMITDHTATTKQVTSAAQSAGLTPPAPHLDAEKTTMLRQLKAASGPARDSLYVQQQQMAHQEALTLHSNYAQGGDNPALKQVAATAVPIIQNHLAQITSMGSTTR